MNEIVGKKTVEFGVKIARKFFSKIFEWIIKKMKIKFDSIYERQWKGWKLLGKRPFISQNKWACDSKYLGVWEQV